MFEYGISNIYFLCSLGNGCCSCATPLEVYVGYACFVLPFSPWVGNSFAIYEYCLKKCVAFTTIPLMCTICFSLNTPFAGASATDTPSCLAGACLNFILFEFAFVWWYLQFHRNEYSSYCSVFYILSLIFIDDSCCWCHFSSLLHSGALEIVIFQWGQQIFLPHVPTSCLWLTFSLSKYCHFCPISILQHMVSVTSAICLFQNFCIYPVWFKHISLCETITSWVNIRCGFPLHW